MGFNINWFIFRQLTVRNSLELSWEVTFRSFSTLLWVLLLFRVVWLIKLKCWRRELTVFWKKDLGEILLFDLFSQCRE